MLVGRPVVNSDAPECGFAIRWFGLCPGRSGSVGCLPSGVNDLGEQVLVRRRAGNACSVCGLLLVRSTNALSATLRSVGAG